MKALSVKQPWAWLICAGHKDVENRTWRVRLNMVGGIPSVRKRIYVHASKSLDSSVFSYDFIRKRVADEVWQEVRDMVFSGNLLGTIIGETDIIDCKFRHGDMNANLFSPWHEIGMWGFYLANPLLYDQPIPCKGKTRIFEPDIPELMAQKRHIEQ